jgi:hypothetical protein
MIDSILNNDENVLSLARKVKDIDGVLRVTWQNVLNKKQIEKYGENGITIFITLYDKNNTEENNTFIYFSIFVSQAVHSDPEKHYMILDGFKEKIKNHFEINN